MKISRGTTIGTTVGPLVHEIDARWLMAYAAGLGETAPEYFDTARADGPLSHPLFPVCYEWPVAADVRAKTLSDEVLVRGVHATHDLRIHRRARAADRLYTTATILTVEPRAPGAYVVTRFETVDAGGGPVSTTDYGSLYLGVECQTETDVSGSPHLPLPPAGRGRLPAPGPLEGQGGEEPEWSVSVPIAATMAHVYTECAQIWNPIHTDRAVAQAAGLPDIILHGTATLALAVSAVLGREPAGPATPVRRVACRFAGMVRMPSRLTVQGLGATASADGRRIAFQALSGEGRSAMRDGLLIAAG